MEKFSDHGGDKRPDTIDRTADTDDVEINKIVYFFRFNYIFGLLSLF